MPLGEKDDTRVFDSKLKDVGKQLRGKGGDRGGGFW